MWLCNSFNTQSKPDSTKEREIIELQQKAQQENKTTKTWKFKTKYEI